MKGLMGVVDTCFAVCTKIYLGKTIRATAVKKINKTKKYKKIEKKVLGEGVFLSFKIKVDIFVEEHVKLYFQIGFSNKGILDLLAHKHSAMSIQTLSLYSEV